MSVAALAALCCSNLANSDQHTTPATSAAGSPASLPELTAEEARAALEHRADAFVRAITRNPGLSNDDSIVRWNRPICLLAAGLTAEDVKIVSAKISQISSSAGAPLARAPCQPNLIIVATSEPDRVLNAWYARDSRLFGDATPALIRQFLEGSQSRPVRVWYNIDMGRKSGIHNGHFVPSNTRADGSTFVRNTVFDFFSIFAIIDTNRTEHATLDQLAAYVAMAGLTNVDLDADLGSAPSILRLFAPSAEKKPSGLSSWDAAFLKALYQSNQTSRTQRLDIAERVAHDISR
ncbi:MAG TPA: hypothetical protein VHS76_03470 [Steroidobacteraceae bacterium]|nr:hypothetical protein [Steroidobacteraceae bacterium]